MVVRQPLIQSITTVLPSRVQTPPVRVSTTVAALVVAATAGLLGMGVWARAASSPAPGWDSSSVVSASAAQVGLTDPSCTDTRVCPARLAATLELH